MVRGVSFPVELSRVKSTDGASEQTLGLESESFPTNQIGR